MLAKDRKPPKVPTEAGRAISVRLFEDATKVDASSVTLGMNHFKLLI